MTNSLFPITREVDSWVSSELVRNLAIFKVPCTTIDSFCRQNAIGEVEILKMDVQGGELLALEGAVEKLSSRAISLVYAEVLMVPLYEGQAFFHEVYSFLAKYGYSLFDLYNIEYAESGQAKWADALFVSPRISRARRPQSFSV
jgi:hypothetical protein